MTAGRELPSGTVTLLFTDIEGSTRLLHELGSATYADALAAHRRLLRDAFSRNGGVEVDTQGDAFFVAFPTASGAVEAAREASAAGTDGPVRVRIGLHTGEPHLTEEGYIGPDVHLGARIAAAGHGGQVLLSGATREAVELDLLDLGEHRLKDFAEPVSIYQLGPGRFPPLMTISNTNLPRPASSFIGRDAEVDALRSLVTGGVRLVTLTGPGGSGKTRLAIEVASELIGEFKAGVFWVGLAAVRDPDLVSDTIGQTLGATDGLAAHIGEREMLLLIDNLEQVVAAAPSLADLAEACPNLVMLVTSREVMRVRGEVEFEVQPLANREAVELFSARAQVPPDETIGTLCQRLDNLPLAVELAAARTRSLTPAQVMERLAQRLDLLRGGRDAEARQQTLRTTIEWSYGLLDEGERRLFAQLSVFAGGCTVDSAAMVAGADLDVLQSLVEKSLVRHAGDRFFMLETIRELAVERLAMEGDADALRRRHADHFLALAEEAEPKLLTADREAVLEGLEREIDNFRAALDMLESSGDTQGALAMSGALAELWDQRGHHAEALRRYLTQLGADEQPTAARAKALSGASMEATKSGDIPLAMRLGEEELELQRRLGNRRGEAAALWGMGYLHLEAGHGATAEQELRQSLDLFRELEDEILQGWVTRTLAHLHYRNGELTIARPLYEENLARSRAAGDAGLEATTLDALATIALREGRADEAAALMREALRIFRGVGDPLFRTAGLGSAAFVLAGLGQPAQAASLLGHAAAQYEELGAREPWVERMNEETAARVRQLLDPAEIDRAMEAGRQLTADDATRLALAALGTRDDAADEPSAASE